jgi:DNA polymerase elongation subunit (family B)
MEEGKIIPTFQSNENWRKFDGAYVKEPVPNLYNSIVSYDLNSLYPMTIITLNMSPETKFGKVKYVGQHAIVEDNTGKETKMTLDNFKNLVKKFNLAVSKSNVLFTQSKKGIFPKLVEEVYYNRVNVKKKISVLKKQDDPDNDYEIQRLSVYQNSLKVLINSLYGYCGNKYAPMSDIDIAESVTLTCQNVIKESGDILEGVVNKLLKTTGVTSLTYQDTDSCYITIQSIIDKYNLDFYNEDKTGVNPKVINICQKIEDKLNQSIKAWGEEELNTKDCRFQFKMEVIADKGLFIAKKNYVVHKYYDEGFDVTEEKKRWKYTGIKLVSASMPQRMKPIVEKILHKIVLTGDKNSSDAEYVKAYEQFENYEYDDIALIKAINKFDEYVGRCDGWNTAKGMLAHYRGAYYYNKLIDDLGVDSKYQRIRQGDKVKTLYLQTTNKYGIDVISYVDNYPEEFKDIFVVDNQIMFEKCIKDIVKQFYDSLKWNIFSPNYQPMVNIDEFFA